MIQDSLRTKLGKDVTLLTVAHRLQSIMDADRIVCSFLCPSSRSSTNYSAQMVLDAGKIVGAAFHFSDTTDSFQVEFASPRELLDNQPGKLRALVDESQDRDILYAMASKQRPPK